MGRVNDIPNGAILGMLMMKGCSIWLD